MRVQATLSLQSRWGQWMKPHEIDRVHIDAATVGGFTRYRDWNEMMQPPDGEGGMRCSIIKQPPDGEGGMRCFIGETSRLASYYGAIARGSPDIRGW
jgi:hypothetical protein